MLYLAVRKDLQIVLGWNHPTALVEVGRQVHQTALEGAVHQTALGLHLQGTSKIRFIGDQWLHQEIVSTTVHP